MINKYSIQQAAVAVCGVVMLLATGCEKVSPTGVLLGTTSADDRVKMSLEVYRDTYDSRLDINQAQGDYSFIVGSDSHLTTDPGRIDELQQMFIDNEDLFIAHLGDIADTKASYYMTLANSLAAGKEKYITQRYHALYNRESKLYIAYTDLQRLVSEGVIASFSEVDTMDLGPLKELLDSHGVEILTADEIHYPFFAVVGNHDITHDGWALFSTIFRTSTYEFTVKVADGVYDQYIFLDSASGTMGRNQIDAIEEGMMRNAPGRTVRHTFVFTHTNIFRPTSNEFASTYAREELYHLLNKFSEWNAKIVFYGHVHKWDDRMFGGVRHLTLDAMSEANSPQPGEYLVRVTCHTDGTLTVDRVAMAYTPAKSISK